MIPFLSPRARPALAPPDPLPDLVRDQVQQPWTPRAAALLAEFRRHVDRVTRSYPDAWFVFARKSDDAVDDLNHRVFTTCARVEKGRYPFSGRVPFRAYVEEQYDGRTIRYHSFYAKLSITRELMRDDYARNLARHPVLRWRADLFREIGQILRRIALPERQGPGLPPRWRLDAPPGRPVEPLDRVQDALAARPGLALEELLRAALERAGPLTQSRLTALVEAVRGTPPAPDLEEQMPPLADLASNLAVRGAVVAAWRALDADDRDLLVALARGDSYDTLVSAHPRFKHKVAVTRAVTRVGKLFVDRIVEDVTEELPGGRDLRPMDLLELVLEVLIEVLPELRAEPLPQELGP